MLDPSQSVSRRSLRFSKTVVHQSISDRLPPRACVLSEAVRSEVRVFDSQIRITYTVSYRDSKLETCSNILIRT